MSTTTTSISTAHPTPTTPTTPTPPEPDPGHDLHCSTDPGTNLPSDDPLGDQIAALCAHIDAATYRLLTLLRIYDEEGRWQGCRSCAHWLSWRTGISLGPAREKVRVAHRLPSLPLISAALAKGEISYSKVRALTRIATGDNEAELLAFSRHGTTAHVERMVREWRRLDRGDDCQADRADRRGLSLHLADDGNYEIRGRLSPEVGALLLKALEATEDKLYREQRAAGTEHETSAPQRRADAFGLWLEERLQPRVQLVVHSFEAEESNAAVSPTDAVLSPADADGSLADAAKLPVNPPIAESACVSAETSSTVMEAPSLVTEEGSRVSAETSSRLCCDAEVVPIARGADGSVLDVGRRRRTVGWRLRKALDARDGGCRFPGCGSRLRTHAHHITHWAQGGETAMDNLVLLCPFHHRAVHEGGWRVEMDERGVPNFFNPQGVRMPVVPVVPGICDLLPGNVSAEAPAGALADAPGPAPGVPLADASAPGSPDFGLARWHGRRGIGPWTGTPRWFGERIDWGLAMVCLWGDGDGRGVNDRAASA
ncbi:MAG: DUF222 domain-containing protein [Gemmatimonadota bacterium]|nr:DUF222 domain-containing protein [Gemmatimonadota bacterium]